MDGQALARLENGLTIIPCKFFFLKKIFITRNFRTYSWRHLILLFQSSFSVSFFLLDWNWITSWFTRTTCLLRRHFLLACWLLACWLAGLSHRFRPRRGCGRPRGTAETFFPPRDDDNDNVPFPNSSGAKTACNNKVGSGTSSGC